MPLYVEQRGDLDRCHACLTDRLTTLNDRATQLLIKYKSGALVTQLEKRGNKLEKRGNELEKRNNKLEKRGNKLEKRGIK